MHKSIRFAAIGTMLAGAAFTTAAQAATTAQADARAEILTTLAVAATQALDFGQIAANGAGTATVGADGSLACDAALVCTGTRLPAAFDVTGTADVGVVATVTDASIDLVNASDNTVTMTVDNFSVYFPEGTTLAGGATTFNVGGVLHVGATQLAGLYSGQFNVSVEYQ